MPDILDEAFDSAIATAHGSTQFRRMARAAAAVQEADQELRAAVGAARQAGDSWSVIGAALGVRRQDAFQKFGRRVDGG